MWRHYDWQLDTTVLRVYVFSVFALEISVRAIGSSSSSSCIDSDPRDTCIVLITVWCVRMTLFFIPQCIENTLLFYIYLYAVWAFKAVICSEISHPAVDVWPAQKSRLDCRRLAVFSNVLLVSSCWSVILIRCVSGRRLAFCPYGAAAREVSRGPEETKSAGAALHQGSREERDITARSAALQCVHRAR